MNKNGNRTFAVMRFEFGNYLRSKFFIYSTAVICALILAGMSAPRIAGFLSGSGAPSSPVEQKRIEIINETDMSLNLADLEEQMPKYTFAEARYGSTKEMFSAVEEKDLAGIFVLHDLHRADWITSRVQLGENPLERLSDLIFTRMKFESMLQENMPPELALKLVTEPRVEVLEAAMFSGKSQTQTQWYTYALVMLLYVSILNYGQMTAVSVASEKSTRAMELLITSTRPTYLIYGKVLGTGLAGLAQMLIFGLAYFAAFSLNRDALAGNEILLNALKMPAATFLMALVTFILSYLSYAFLFAALGSLVSRSEEVNQAVAPLLLLYMGVIMLTLFATFYPEQTWVTILSFVPLAGILLIFVRYSMLQVPLLEFAIALLIHTVTVMLCSKIAVAIYRNGILRYGKAPRLSEMIKLLQKKKD